MNEKQKKTMWIGIGIIELMCLFPPCVTWHPKRSGQLETEKTGYYAIWSIPHRDKVKGRDGNERSFIVKGVNMSVLGIRIFVVALLTGGLMVTFAGRENKSD